MMDEISTTTPERSVSEKLADILKINNKQSDNIGQTILAQHGEHAAARFVSTQQAVNNIFAGLTRDGALNDKSFDAVHEAILYLSESLVNGDAAKTHDRIQKITESKGELSRGIKRLVSEIGGTSGPTGSRDTGENTL